MGQLAHFGRPDSARAAWLARRASGGPRCDRRPCAGPLTGRCHPAAPSARRRRTRLRHHQGHRNRGSARRRRAHGVAVEPAHRPRNAGRRTDPVTEELICPSTTLVDEVLAKHIEEAGIQKVKTVRCSRATPKKAPARSATDATSRRARPLTWVKRWVSWPPRASANRAPSLRSAPSTSAARPPGSSRVERDLEIDGRVQYVNIETVDHKNGVIVMNRTGEVVVFDEHDRERYRYNVPYGVTLKVLDGAEPPRGRPFSNGTRTTTSSWPPKPGRLSSSTSSKAKRRANCTTSARG